VAEELRYPVLHQEEQEIPALFLRLEQHHLLVVEEAVETVVEILV
tara:strand:+ start:261 stop:395 length:135 start_codon:yes stop_codon:yes gene_type:complete